MASSRVQHLELTLSILGFTESLRALDLMIKVMCKDNGYKRHNNTHYYYHLVDVAQKLLNFGIRDQDVITAALLHDYVEDVPGIKIEDVRKEFGAKVAYIVDLVTKKRGVDYKEEKNIVAYLDNISLCMEAALVKTTDRIHNFSTLIDATPEKKIRQALETEKYFIPFFKTCRNLYPRYANIFFEAKTQIEPHLWEIKEHQAEVSLLKKEIEELKKQIKKP